MFGECKTNNTLIIFEDAIIRAKGVLKHFHWIPYIYILVH